MNDADDPRIDGYNARTIREDQAPVPGGTTAIRDGQYVTEERAPGPPSPDDSCPVCWHPHMGGAEQTQLEIERAHAALVAAAEFAAREFRRLGRENSALQMDAALASKGGE